jgi:hypothetical protein
VTPTGAGIQKWRFNGTTWSLVTTFNTGYLFVGATALAARRTGTTYTLVTTNTNGGNLVLVVDDGSLNPSPRLLSSIPQNAGYAGVAILPQ